MNDSPRINSECHLLDEFVDDAAAGTTAATSSQQPGKVDGRFPLVSELVDDAGESAARRATPAQWEKAIGNYEQQLQEARQAGDRRGEVAILLSLAAAYARLGRREPALPLLERAAQLGQEAGDAPGVRLANTRLKELHATVPREPEVVRRTVVRVDLVGYSDIVSQVQQQLGPKAVSHLDKQIEGFVRQALTALNSNVLVTLLRGDGDGFFLGFETAERAVRFAEKIHELCAVENRTKKDDLTRRHFRIGIFTGDIVLAPQTSAGGEFKGFSIAAGTMAICSAVRLEAACRIGEVVIDAATWVELPPAMQVLFGEQESVAGKRDERFIAYRRRVLPTAGNEVPGSHKQAATRSRRDKWIPRAGILLGMLVLGLLVLWALGVLRVPTKYGIIVVKDLPVDAEVLVDGGKVTVSWGDDRNAQLSVRPGPRKIIAKTDEGKITLTKDGMLVAGDEVIVEENGKIILKASLEPLAKGFDKPLVHTLTGHSGTVRFLLFAPNGRLVSAGNSNHYEERDNLRYSMPGVDNSVRVWNVESGRQVRFFNVAAGSQFGPQGLCISPDGRLIAASSSWEWGRTHIDGEPTVQVWDIDSGVRKYHFRAPGDRAMRAVTFAKDGKSVFAVRSGVAIHEWSIVDGQKLGDWERPTANPGEMPFATIFTPNGQRIVGGMWNGAVAIWNCKTGEKIKEFKLHEKVPTAIAITKDGKRILSTGEDYSTRLWDLESENELLTLTGQDAIMRSAAFTADGKLLVTGGDDGVIHLRDATTGNEREQFREHACPVHSLAVSPDGKLLASGAADGTICIWRLPL